MAIKFFDPTVTYKKKAVVKKSAAKAKKSAKKQSDIKTSDKVSGVELRLLPPFIKDNSTKRFGPFPGYAKLYCVVIVVSDANNQMVGGIDLQGFPRIGDEEHLPINKTVFYWEKKDKESVAPTQIHMMCSVIKSKAGLRQAGEILSEIKDDKGYKTITQKLAGFAKNATAAGAVISVVEEIAALVGKKLTQVEDKPIGTVIQSYTVLRGDFDKTGVITLDYPVKKVDFKFELIVRDQAKAVGAGVKSAKKAAKAAVVVDTEPVEVDMMPIA